MAYPITAAITTEANMKYRSNRPSTSQSPVGPFPVTTFTNSVHGLFRGLRQWDHATKPTHRAAVNESHSRTLIGYEPMLGVCPAGRAGASGCAVRSPGRRPLELRRGDRGQPGVERKRNPWTASSHIQCSPGGATEGSQGWSVSGTPGQRHPTFNAAPEGRPRTGRPSGATWQFHWARIPGVALAFGSLHPWLPSVAPPGLHGIGAVSGPGVALAFGSLHPWLPSVAPPGLHGNFIGPDFQGLRSPSARSTPGYPRSPLRGCMALGPSPAQGLRSPSARSTPGYPRSPLRGCIEWAMAVQGLRSPSARSTPGYRRSPLRGCMALGPSPAQGLRSPSARSTPGYPRSPLRGYKGIDSERRLPGVYATTPHTRSSFTRSASTPRTSRRTASV